MYKKEYLMFINGKWLESSSNERFNTVNPYSNEVWATIPQATSSDVRLAITSARNAFEKWKRFSGLTRASLLFKLADLLDLNADRLAEIETTDNGKVIRETKSQMHFAARNYRYFAGYADKLYGDVIPLDNYEVFDYTIREPIGVVAIITSWNSPISILANKLAPALAAGNTVIIKPSEHASASTLEFGRLIEEVGFPEGVVNIVTGDGEVGDLLTKNPLINKISFTGGTETGKKIAANASANLIPLTLELGGKSPNIIFDDSNIDDAVNGAIAGIFAAAGQTCIAGSRLLVQESIYRTVVDKIVDRAKQIKMGDPLNYDTEMGPVANETQYNAIRAYIQKGIQEGANLILGGERPRESGLENGYFINPTIFTDVSNDMAIAREEIFGPVLCIIPFSDEQEAIEIANDSDFGLAAGIWSENVKRVHKIAKEIEVGTVWINTYRMSAAQAPFGGTKLSGYGRERGWHALLEYSRVKNVMLDVSNNIPNPFKLRT